MCLKSLQLNCKHGRTDSHTGRFSSDQARCGGRLSVVVNCMIATITSRKLNRSEGQAAWTAQNCCMMEHERLTILSVLEFASQLLSGTAGLWHQRWSARGEIQGPSKEFPLQKHFARNVFINQEWKSDLWRWSDNAIVLTVNNADWQLDTVSFPALVNRDFWFNLIYNHFTVINLVLR